MVREREAEDELWLVDDELVDLKIGNAMSSLIGRFRVDWRSSIFLWKGCVSWGVGELGLGGGSVLL